MLNMVGKRVRLVKGQSQVSCKNEHSSVITSSKQNTASNDNLGVTVKVAEPDYVPLGVQVRGKISPLLFTATVNQCDIQRLETDPKIISISAPRNLHTTQNHRPAAS